LFGKPGSVFASHSGVRPQRRVAIPGIANQRKQRYRVAHFCIFLERFASLAVKETTKD
jgi:hypothetical protein